MTVKPVNNIYLIILGKKDFCLCLQGCHSLSGLIDLVKVTIIRYITCYVVISNIYLWRFFVLIPYIPDAYSQLIEDTIRLARQHHIDVCFEQEERTFSCEMNIGAVGYFDSGTGRLAVCITEGWLETFVHESCHMEQYLNDTVLWNRLSEGVIKFNQYCTGEIKLSNEELYDVIQLVIASELDCEKRVVAKIKKYKLPIDIKEYKQRINTYLYTYLTFLKTYTWYDHYMVKEVYSLAPARFQKEYRKVPVKLLAAMEKQAAS